jgi:hypothetical protein
VQGIVHQVDHDLLDLNGVEGDRRVVASDLDIRSCVADTFVKDLDRLLN